MGRLRVQPWRRFTHDIAWIALAVAIVVFVIILLTR